MGGEIMHNPRELLIDDSTDLGHPDVTAGFRGLIPRDYATHPQGCYSSAPAAVDMPLIPRAEWRERIRHMEGTKSRLSDMRMTGMFGQMIPSRDQNGKGYCWAHSTVSAMMLLRARDNQPYADLSAYAIACIIKNFRDEGGWGALSLDFATQRGCPTSQFWPQQSMSRVNDNNSTWANAALHRTVEGWVDLNAAVYDRDLTFDQVMTCLLLRIPVVVDFNWWGHSVCAADPVETSPGQFGIRIWNSWGDSWSDKGMGVLSGSRAIPDGAVAPRTVTASSI